MGRRLGSLGRPGLVAVAALAALLLSWLLAAREAVPQFELDLTVWFADAPEWVADVLYPPMQLGTVAGPVLVALGIAAIRRDWWLSGATLVAGLVTWFGAKGVKRLVDRGRPRRYLPELTVREGDGTGLGFVSGHSAVAACAAVMVMVALPPRWRPLPAALVVAVGIARMVHGVHLPVDVVGGWAFGTLVALGALWVLERVEPDRAPAASVAVAAR
jgi:undecaprenyl-diphosphatase